MCTEELPNWGAKRLSPDPSLVTWKWLVLPAVLLHSEDGPGDLSQGGSGGSGRSGGQLQCFKTALRTVGHGQLAGWMWAGWLRAGELVGQPRGLGVLELGLVPEDLGIRLG
jgi:hypothetical protein